MKKYFFYAVCFLLFISFLTIYNANSEKRNFTSKCLYNTDEQEEEASKSKGLDFKDYSVSVNGSSYNIVESELNILLNSNGNEIQVKYPQIMISENVEFQDSLNDLLYTVALHNIEIEELDTKFNVQLFSDYVITFSGETIVSILFHFNVFSQAKAFEYYEGITFSPQDGRIFNLSDLVADYKTVFLNGENYKLSYSIDMKTIEEREEQYNRFDEYTNLQNNFYVSKKRLGFILYVGGTLPDNVVYEVDLPLDIECQ